MIIKQRHKAIPYVERVLRLKPMVQYELIADDGDALQVQPAGRLLIRAIYQIFDLYRKEGASQGLRVLSDPVGQM